eukprot:TRINITY_DN9771_c0_g2_i1.p1 TRINITY_DN9771_c0_g2~~TRINITY_DN9771_c0_g2_i1.p1  ORF type:complete len:203 (+),score=19.38 TRINITY_DN9771_c0_g2_i1:70-609(+)
MCVLPTLSHFSYHCWDIRHDFLDTAPTSFHLIMLFSSAPSAQRALQAVLSDSTTLGSLDFFDVNELLAVFENAPECDECGRGAGKPALGLEYKVGCYRYDGRLKRLCVACFGSLQRCDGCGKKYCSCDGCNDMDYPACDSSLCDDCLDEHIMTCKVCLQRSVQEEVLEDARREVMPWRG